MYDKLALSNLSYRDLCHELAEAQTSFQEYELKVDRRRALLTGEAAAAFPDNTPDTMAVIKTNHYIAQDEQFAEMQEELIRRGAYARMLKAELTSRDRR